MENGQAFIAGTTELENLKSLDEVYKAIGRQLKNYYKNEVVVVSHRIPGSDIIRLKFSEGWGSVLDKIISMLGRRFEDMDFKGSEEAKTVMPLGKPYFLSGGFYQLALGEVPQSVAKVIEKLLSLNKIYAIAFTENKKVLGAVIIIFKHNEDLREPGILEEYIRRVSKIVAQKKPPRVLFLDDEEAIRDMVKEILWTEGYGITTVEKGEEAVAEYIKELNGPDKYDAGLFDLYVSGSFGGKEAAAQILKADPKASLIACTGKSVDSMLTEYKTSGFKEMLAKPFTIDELLGVISRVKNG